jgi:hypothetical protein
MSYGKIARRRPKRKKAKHATLMLSPEAKDALWELVQSWEGIQDGMGRLAARQAANKDYLTACENYLLSEGVGYCASELRKLLPAK